MAIKKKKFTQKEIDEAFEFGLKKAGAKKRIKKGTKR